MKKILLSLVFVLVIIVYFSSPKKIYATSQDMNNDQENDIAEQHLIPLLKALENRDIAQMYELCIEESIENPEKSEQIFEEFFNTWNDRKWSSYKMISQAKRPAEGKAPSAIIYNYEIICEKDTIKIEFSVVDSRKKMDGISISLQKIGMLQTWLQFSTAQWLFFGLALLEIVFSIYVAILCIRSKPKLWGLWLVFILTIYCGIVFPTQLNPKLTLFVNTFIFPKLTNYQDMIYDSPVKSIVNPINIRYNRSNTITRYSGGQLCSVQARMYK